MGLRIRQSFKLAPGVRITVSKSGVSYSAGVRGARITKTARGNVTSTVGIPGSGISYTTNLSNPRSQTGAGRLARALSGRKQAAKARSGFISLIRLEGLLPHCPEKALIERAEGLCSELNEGLRPSTLLIREITSGVYASRNEAGAFVKRAVVAFSPDHLTAVLTAWDGDPAVRRAVVSR